MSEKNSSELFAANAVRATYDDLDERTVERAKERLADCVGCFSCGAKGVGVAGMVDMVRGYGGKEEASIYNYGGKVPAHYAAFVNSLQVRSFDSEPIDSEGFLARWPAHVASSTVPVALTMAEWKHLSGKDFLIAMLLGDDMASRITETLNFDPLGCFDGNGTVNVPSSALIAAKVLGLDEVQTLDALGLAINLSGGTMHNTQGFWTFKLGNSYAAMNGILAAEMAQHGFKGLDDPLTGDKCFFQMFSSNPRLECLTRDLGKVYFADSVIKPWSGCRDTHVVLDAVRNALQGTTLRAQDIDHVRYGGSPSITNGEFRIGDADETSGLFNRRFAIATYILAGKVNASSYTREWMENEEFQDLLGKLEFFDYNPNPDAQGAARQAACVDITMKDGQVIHGEVVYPILGDVDYTPLPREWFLEKFEMNAAFGGMVDMGKLRAAFDMAYEIDTVDDMAAFAELLVP